MFNNLTPQDHANIAAFINAVGSIAVAVFTYWVWRLQRQMHWLNSYASLRFGGMVAYFEAHNVLRVEAAIINRTKAPAVITSWKVTIADKTLHEELGTMNPAPTRRLKVPKYVGGPAWVVNQELPVVAISLAEQLTNPKIVKGAKVDLEVTYLGGEQESETISMQAAIE